MTNHRKRKKKKQNKTKIAKIASNCSQEWKKGESILDAWKKKKKEETNIYISAKKESPLGRRSVRNKVIAYPMRFVSQDAYERDSLPFSLSLSFFLSSIHPSFTNPLLFNKKKKKKSLLVHSPLNVREPSGQNCVRNPLLLASIYTYLQLKIRARADLKRCCSTDICSSPAMLGWARERYTRRSSSGRNWLFFQHNTLNQHAHTHTLSLSLSLSLPFSLSFSLPFALSLSLIRVMIVIVIIVIIVVVVVVAAIIVRNRNDEIYVYIYI